MPSTAEGGGTAHDATVVTQDGTGRSTAYQAGTPQHADHLDYLERVADDADESVRAAEQQIADLKDSLADRRAVAKQARADLRAAQKRED